MGLLGPWGMCFVFHKTLQVRWSSGAAELVSNVLQGSPWELKKAQGINGHFSLVGSKKLGA